MIDDIYSAAVLRLAADLPHAGRLARPDGSGERIAKLCGSRAVVDVRIGRGGEVEHFAQDVKACALGQAAAAVVGAHAVGADLGQVLEARDAMADMLKRGGEGPVGRFEGLRLLKPVAAYPARHASSMVAIEALAEAIEAAMTRFPTDGGAVWREDVDDRTPGAGQA